MRYLPYALGLFMLFPLVLWAGLWLFVFPGPKPGFDVPVVTALVATSLPLAAWHFVAALGFIANSMAGRAGEERLLWPPARLFLRAMPASSILIGVSGSVWMAALGEHRGVIAAPLASGLAMAWIMGVARKPGRRLSAPFTAAARGTDAAVALACRVLLAVPVLGGLLREIGRDPHRAAPWVMINLAAVTVIAVSVFGPGVLVIPAMAMVPVAFYLLFALTLEDA